jgi:hypothetical protein
MDNVHVINMTDFEIIHEITKNNSLNNVKSKKFREGLTTKKLKTG